MTPRFVPVLRRAFAFVVALVVAAQAGAIGLARQATPTAASVALPAKAHVDGLTLADWSACS